MIAVTICVGEPYKRYAQKAAEAFEKHTGLKTLILDDVALKAVSGHRIFDDVYSLKNRAFILKFFIPHFIGREDFVYFDCDYLCVADWSPEKASEGIFCAVLDRTKYLMEAKKDLCIHPLRYFNSGMMIVPSKDGFALSNRCLRDYDVIKRHFYDQCSWNHAVQSLDIRIKLLDRRFNCMNYGGEFTKYDIKAIHCSSNYYYYDENIPRPTTPEKLVDLGKMKEFSAANPNYFPDGTTINGDCWFIDTSNEFNLFDNYGTKLETSVN